MFSGLVRGDAYIQTISKKNQTIELTVTCTDDFTHDLVIGDSIAVNGTCLTVERFKQNSFSVTMMPQTYKKTIFSNSQAGDQLNVERSLKIGQRLEGHLVTGHIDGLARVIKKEKNENAIELWLSLPSHLSSQIVPQGSIALNGVSLTIMDVKDNNFSVGLIPHTQNETNLSRLQINDEVNVETDIIGKYVARNLMKKD